ALDGHLATLQAKIISQAFTASAPGRVSPGDILGTALAPPSVQQAFLTRYLTRDGTVAEFWDRLSADPTFQAPGIVDDLRLTVQLGLLTQGNVPLMRRLQDLRRRGRVHSLRDLTTIDEAGWREELRQAAA